jgi:hypothetical protein
MYRSENKGSVTVRVFLVSMCPDIDDAFIREFEPTYFCSGCTYLSIGINKRTQASINIIHNHIFVSITSINKELLEPKNVLF